MLFSTLKTLGPCVLWYACHQPATNGFAPFIEFLTIRLLKEDGHLGASVERWTATSDGEAFRCMRSDAPVELTPEDHIVAALRLWLAENPPPDTTTGGKSLVTR